jgi:hypothetical protein
MDDTQALPLNTWLDLIAKDYIGSFVPAGGSGVKVVVASKAQRDLIRSTIQHSAYKRACIYTHVDGNSVAIHKLEDTFTSIAGQISWKDVARRFVERKLTAEGLALPLPMEAFSIPSIAAANDQPSQFVANLLNRIAEVDILRDRRLCPEFRRAAAALCPATYDRSSDRRKQSEHVQEWFQGNAPAGSLKKIGISKKIHRGNARRLLESTTIFLKEAGYGGIVYTIDMSQYALSKAALFGRTFNAAAAFEMYEAVRQFIDGIDGYRSALFLFLTCPEFLDETKVGLRNYEALRLRLTGDVWDRRRPNPYAPMVLLEGSR